MVGIVAEILKYEWEKVWNGCVWFVILHENREK